MKRLLLLPAVLCLCAVFCPQAQAQEHYTEGTVWVINYYRTKPGKFDDYMKFLRSNYARVTAEQKKAGVILDTKVLLQPSLNGPNDWDVAVAYLFPSYAKALDFSQADFDKAEEIAAKHYQETNRDKRAATNDAARLPIRDFVATRIMREVGLRPMP
jgi:hypothetical protein